MDINYDNLVELIKVYEEVIKGFKEEGRDTTKLEEKLRELIELKDRF